LDQEFNSVRYERVIRSVYASPDDNFLRGVKCGVEENTGDGMKVRRTVMGSAVSQSEMYERPTSKQGDLQPLISSRYQARRRRAICDGDRLPWLRNHPPDERNGQGNCLAQPTPI